MRLGCGQLTALVLQDNLVNGFEQRPATRTATPAANPYDVKQPPAYNRLMSRRVDRRGGIVDELAHHPGRDQRGFAGGGRRGRWSFELVNCHGAPHEISRLPQQGQTIRPRNGDRGREGWDRPQRRET
jgi:hypothetical protein